MKAPCPKGPRERDGTPKIRKYLLITFLFKETSCTT
jgi:hypothetical protein